MCQRPFASFIDACSLDTDACSTATSTRGSRPMRLPSEIACATPHASISEARGLGTREKICSLVMPGEAIATPCEVHSTPIERGDEQSRQLTMHIDDHPVGSIDARDWSYQLTQTITPTARARCKRCSRPGLDFSNRMSDSAPCDRPGMPRSVRLPWR